MTLSNIFALVLIGSSSGRQLRRLSDPDPDLWLTKSDTEAGASLDNLWRSDAFSDEELDQLLDDGKGENGGNRDFIASGEEDDDDEDVGDAEVRIQGSRRRRRSIFSSGIPSIPGSSRRRRSGQSSTDWPRIVTIHWTNDWTNGKNECHCKIKGKTCRDWGRNDGWRTTAAFGLFDSTVYTHSCPNPNPSSCACPSWRPTCTTGNTNGWEDGWCIGKVEGWTITGIRKTSYDHGWGHGFSCGHSSGDPCSQNYSDGCSWKVANSDRDKYCTGSGVKQLDDSISNLGECKAAAEADPECDTSNTAKNCNVFTTSCWRQRAEELEELFGS